MDLDEFAFGQHGTDHVALGAERADERGQHDQPGIRHQLRHLADTANVFGPVGLGEAEIAVEPVADIVAIEQEGVTVHEGEPLFHRIGDGRLARTGEAGEPQYARRLVLHLGTLGPRDVGRLPVDVLRPPQGKMQHPGGDRGIRLAVDQDEPAQRPVFSIGLKHDPPVGMNLGHTDLVELQRLGGHLVERVYIDAVFRLAHTDRHALCAELQQIGTIDLQRCIVEPHQRRLELVGGLRRGSGGRDHIAARAIDLILEHQRDRLSRLCARQWTIETLDPRDAALAA